MKEEERTLLAEQQPALTQPEENIIPIAKHVGSGYGAGLSSANSLRMQKPHVSAAPSKNSSGNLIIAL